MRGSPELTEGMQYGSRAVAGQCKHCAYSTEKTYVCCAAPLILCHEKGHLLQMGEKEISEFLNYLAAEENAVALTQHQRCFCPVLP